MIDTAMVLAAGLGTRLRPLTLEMPKPLLPLGGKTMLDHALDHAAAAGVQHAVVNVHYLAGKILAHVAQRTHPAVMISDETDALLETGGGIKRALPLLNRDGFFTLNSDVMWRDLPGEPGALQHMQVAWNSDIMDSLLLLVPQAHAVGFADAGDYFCDATGRLTWRGGAADAPYIFAGASIAKAADFANYAEDRFSQKRIWDLHEAAGRLYGVIHTGTWYHCSTPADYDAVTKALA